MRATFFRLSTRYQIFIVTLPKSYIVSKKKQFSRLAKTVQLEGTIAIKMGLRFGGEGRTQSTALTAEPVD